MHTHLVDREHAGTFHGYSHVLGLVTPACDFDPFATSRNSNVPAIAANVIPRSWHASRNALGQKHCKVASKPQLHPDRRNPDCVTQFSAQPRIELRVGLGIGLLIIVKSFVGIARVGRLGLRVSIPIANCSSRAGHRRIYLPVVHVHVAHLPPAR